MERLKKRWEGEHDKFINKNSHFPQCERGFSQLIKKKHVGLVNVTRKSGPATMRPIQIFS